MCLMEGDNVATWNVRSSAESLHASISLEQSDIFQTENWSFVIRVNVACVGAHTRCLRVTPQETVSFEVKGKTNASSNYVQTLLTQTNQIGLLW